MSKKVKEELDEIAPDIGCFIFFLIMFIFCLYLFTVDCWQC